MIKGKLNQSKKIEIEFLQETIRIITFSGLREDEKAKEINKAMKRINELTS